MNISPFLLNITHSFRLTAGGLYGAPVNTHEEAPPRRHCTRRIYLSQVCDIEGESNPKRIGTTPMPFVIPRYRRFFHGNEAVDLGPFKDVETSGDFRLQVRKKNLRILASHRCRITHSVSGKAGFYVIARGQDLEEMRKGPWSYVAKVSYPQNLTRSQMVSWIVGHFTQIAMEETSSKGVAATSKIGRRERKKRERVNATKLLKDVSHVALLSERAAIGRFGRSVVSLATQREVFIVVTFGTVLSLLRKDLMIFLSVVTVVNTYLLLVGTISSKHHRDPLSMKDNVSSNSSRSSSPLSLNAGKESRRKALLRLAAKMEGCSTSDLGPSGVLADELADLYRAVADMMDIRELDEDEETTSSESTHPPEGDGDHLLFEIVATSTPRFVLPYWSSMKPMDPSYFMVRGPTYLQDGGVKIPSGPAVYEYVGWDGFRVKSKFYHASRFMTIPLPKRVKDEVLRRKASLSEEGFEALKKRTVDAMSCTVAGVPRYFVINLQLPDYDPSIYNGPWDGPGFALVAYFTLTESSMRQLEAMEASETGKAVSSSADDFTRVNVQGALRNEEDEEKVFTNGDRVLERARSNSRDRHDSADEKVQDDNDDELGEDGEEGKNTRNIDLDYSFDSEGVIAGSTIHPNALRLLRRYMSEPDLETAYDRSKGYLGRTKLWPVCQNLDELLPSLNGLVRKQLKRYNGKPLICAPLHKFYRGKGYVEYNMDLHRYSYLQRTLSRAVRPMYSRGQFAVGFSVEGRDAAELPEQMTVSCQIDKIDFENLTPIEEAYEVPEDRLPGHKRW